jgi:hypothetical protein
MAETTKMICPFCHIEMNQHAIKCDYNVEDSDSIDPIFGGVLEEIHTCPNCGHTELRAE